MTSVVVLLAVALLLPCFYDLGLSRLGFKHKIFGFRGQRSNPLRHRRGLIVIYLFRVSLLLTVLFSLILYVHEKKNCKDHVGKIDL